MAYHPSQQDRIIQFRAGPREKNNLANQNPEKVKELQKRAEALAAESVKPLFFKEFYQAAWIGLTETVALPEDAKAIESEP